MGAAVSMSTAHLTVIVFVAIMLHKVRIAFIILHLLSNFNGEIEK
jgi:hypothetical protein